MPTMTTVPEAAGGGVKTGASSAIPGLGAGGNPRQFEELFKKLMKSQDETTMCKFEGQPSVPQFRKWKTHFYKEVSGNSGRPDEAFTWIKQVEQAKSMDELYDCGEFRKLDSKVATGLGKILQGELGRQVQVKEEQIGAEGKLLRGRQIA